MFELILCVHRSLRSSSGYPISEDGLARPPLSPRSSFRPFLVMPWRGILCLGATSFLSFLSFQSKTEKRQPLPPSLVWNECSTLILHDFSHQNKSEFSGISSLCFLSSFSPSASLGHHLPHSTFSDGVSSKKIYNSAPGRITLLSASKPVPRVNKRVFV